MNNYIRLLKAFADLAPAELYAILRLRNEVFVVEQQCVYQDLDNKDLKGWHLMLFDNDATLVAYARLLPPGVSYAEASIGRVVTRRDVRGTGVGRLIMQTAIDCCAHLFPHDAIRIGAQVYAQRFYELLGFVGCGSIYDEDGIAHIEMLRPSPSDIA